MFTSNSHIKPTSDCQCEHSWQWEIAWLIIVDSQLGLFVCVCSKLICLHTYKTCIPPDLCDMQALCKLGLWTFKNLWVQKERFNTLFMNECMLIYGCHHQWERHAGSNLGFFRASWYRPQFANFGLLITKSGAAGNGLGELSSVSIQAEASSIRIPFK